MCSSVLVYVSFSFSHKCPGLVGASSRLQSDALCENAHHHADYSSAQWAVTTLDRCQQTQPTSQHRNGVSAAAGAPGTDAAADALAAVGVNCSSSSSPELSACWLGCRVGMSANGVARSTQELQCVVRTTVEAAHACFDACFIHQVRLELRTSNLQAVTQTSNVVHAVDGRIL